MIAVSDACFRCGVCVKACPVPGTITSVMPGRVRVNGFTCTSCEQCIPVCPAGALSVQPDPVPVVNVAEVEVAQEESGDDTSSKTRKSKRG